MQRGASQVDVVVGFTSRRQRHLAVRHRQFGDESRERLGIERIDLLYLHDPERHDLDLALAEALPAMEHLRADGQVAAVGIGGRIGGVEVSGVGDGPSQAAPAAPES